MPMKIKPKKICTGEKFATIITVGYLNPQKFIPVKILPTKYCDHENDMHACICTHLPLQHFLVNSDSQSDQKE